MATPPASAPRPAAPTIPTGPSAPAPAGMVVARWLYVDEAHQHEVMAGLRHGPKAQFVVREGAFHNTDPTEFIEQAQPLESPWEAQLYHWQLECRLAILGKYWKHDGQNPGWRALVKPQGAPELDLREVVVNPYRGRATFHHFHQRKLGQDNLLVAVPNATPQGPRMLLARADFKFPNGADADITLLHAHLPDAPARSVIVREHMSLKEKGFEKLVWGQDYMLAHGRAWQREAGQVFADVLQRISEGRFGAVSHDRAAIVDPIYTDFLNALTDPRLLALQARYLTPEEQQAALAGGESAIRRLIAKKREAAPHEEQHKLTIVEASLLARDQLRPGQRARVDPEVASLVRRFAFYL